MKKKVVRKKLVKGPINRKHPNGDRTLAIEASKGNHYWKDRSKHGRDKIFETAEILQQEIQAYFDFVDATPDYEVKPLQEKGKIKLINVPRARPYTIQGLCGYLDITTSYFRVLKKQYDPIKDKDFITVVAWMEDKIYNQQFSKATNGFFNANIIARALGLIDRQDITSGDAPVQPPTVNIIKGAAPKISTSEDEVGK
jgi:hypothetical protein